MHGRQQSYKKQNCQDWKTFQTEDQRNIFGLLELQNPIQQRLNEDMDRATTYDQEDQEYIQRDGDMKSKLQNAWYTSPSNSQADQRDGQVDR
jgi:hypothetical protein